MMADGSTTGQAAAGVQRFVKKTLHDALAELMPQVQREIRTIVDKETGAALERAQAAIAEQVGGLRSEIAQATAAIDEAERRIEDRIAQALRKLAEHDDAFGALASLGDESDGDADLPAFAAQADPVAPTLADLPDELVTTDDLDEAVRAAVDPLRAIIGELTNRPQVAPSAGALSLDADRPALVPTKVIQALAVRTATLEMWVKSAPDFDQGEWDAFRKDAERAQAAHNEAGADARA